MRGHASRTTPGSIRPGPYQDHACRRPAVAAAAAAVPRTASRPPWTARTDNGPDLTVKARSQPGPTKSTEPDYLRAGIHAEDADVSVPDLAVSEIDQVLIGCLPWDLRRLMIMLGCA